MIIAVGRRTGVILEACHARWLLRIGVLADDILEITTDENVAKSTRPARCFSS